MKKGIRLLCLLVVLLSAITAKANCKIEIPQQELKAGNKTTLAIHLTNEEEVTAFQFDMVVPSGFTINTMVNEDDETVPDIQLTERKKSKHQLSSARQDDGTYKIVALSMSNQAFRDNSGAIVYVSITPSGTLSAGTYSIQLKNIHIVTLEGGVQGQRIDQPDYIGNVTIANESQEGDVNVSLSISTSELQAGKSNQNLNIMLKNNIDVTAFQLDLKLPQGITVNKYMNEDDEEVPNIQLTSRKKSSHQISSNQREDGTYSIVVLSMKNQALNGTDGDVITLNVNVPLTVSGKQTFSMSNIHIVPLVNGMQGVRIDQPDETKEISIVNDGTGGETPIGGMNFTIAPLKIKPGETGTLQICMNNEQDVCSFQFNLKLPEGISIVKEYNEDDEFVEAIALSERKKSSHELNFKQTTDGGYFLLAYSLSNATFRNNSGCIITIKVKADANLEYGNYGAVITNALLVTPNEEKFKQDSYGGTISVTNNTAVKDAFSDKVRIYRNGQHCLIEGTQTSDVVYVYDLNGVLLNKEKSVNEKTAITLNNIPMVIVVVERDGQTIATQKLTFK